MPNRPGKYCALAHSGRCAPSHIIEAGHSYCQFHDKSQKKLHDSNRETATKRGYGTRWQKARKTYLANNPLCVHHRQQGRVIQATVVDHIIPHKGNYELMWDQDNWQALCRTCHDSWKQREEKRGGRGKKPTPGLPTPRL